MNQLRNIAASLVLLVVGFLCLAQAQMGPILGVDGPWTRTSRGGCGGTIAFAGTADGGNNGGTTNSLTFSYTSGSGSCRLLVVGIAGDTSVSGGGSNFDDITSVTYNGVGMTLAAKQSPGTQDRWSYIYYIPNPTIGANNVVINSTNVHFLLAGAADYTGVSGLDTTTSQLPSPGVITTLTTSITTVANNSWAILLENAFTATLPPSAGTGSTRRTFDAAFGTWGLFDSNVAITPAGSYSMTTNRPSGVDTITHIIASFKP